MGRQGVDWSRGFGGCFRGVGIGRRDRQGIGKLGELLRLGVAEAGELFLDAALDFELFVVRAGGVGLWCVFSAVSCELYESMAYLRIPL